MKMIKVGDRVAVPWGYLLTQHQTDIGFTLALRLRPHPIFFKTKIVKIKTHHFWIFKRKEPIYIVELKLMALKFKLLERAKPG